MIGVGKRLQRELPIVRDEAHLQCANKRRRLETAFCALVGEVEPEYLLLGFSALFLALL